MADRVISSAVQAGIEEAESPDAIIAFLTVKHPRLSAPIRVVSDLFDYVVGGNTFLGLPFEFSLLSDDEAAAQTELRIQNVDRRIGLALRAIPDRAQITLEIRSTADFNLSVDPRTEIATSVVYSFADFDLVDVTVTAEEVRGRVMLRDYSQEVFPGIRATQSRCPGLFV